MDIFGVFYFLGGVALFLFGMNLMSEAIGRQAVGRFKGVLENLTANPALALILGTGVTAVIQSSAATSVMVLGFINSGIMTLESSIPIIMGANIGTCATSWLLSLNSISGTSFVLRLLNPSSFTPILAAVGAYLLLFTKRDRQKDIGNVLLGFAILMFGMDFISDSLSPLTGSDGLRSVMAVLSNPVVGILFGFVITAGTQSSSASIGILQAVSVTGGITFEAALPMILGINIGATLIVLLSSVGGNRDAKRCALIGTLYNIFGAVLVQAVFSILNAVFHFSVAAMPVGYISIAATHTIYKTLIAIIFLPLSKQLIKLAKLIIPLGKSENRFHLLDERLLNTPSVAIARCRELSVYMAQLSRSALTEVLEMRDTFSEPNSKRIADMESEIDNYEDKLGSAMVKLSSVKTSQPDSLEISRILHCIGDIERISDHAVNIMSSYEEMYQKNITFSAAAREDLEVMYAAVNEIVRMAVNAFETGDMELAAHVEPLEQVIDHLQSQMKARHIARLQRGECTILLGFVFQDIITNCERIADHCSNIAVCLIQVSRSSFDTHKYLNKLKTSDDQQYEGLYRDYLEEYALS